MFSKTQLFVLIVFIVGFVFGCKKLDYGALDTGVDSLVSPWAMASLQILNDIDDPTDEGEVVLHLSENLAQEANVQGVNLKFVANGTLTFNAPDASNIATLTEDDVLIKTAEINFVNGANELVCPTAPIVANLINKNGEDGVIYEALNVACSGNPRVEMNALATSIEELSAVASHAWLENHKDILAKTEEFFQREKEKGEQGALHKTEDEAINKAIDYFLIKRKMLTGYDAMHTELEKHRDIGRIKTQMKNKKEHKDSDKHVVIPAVMNAFLDTRVNNRVVPDDAADDGRDTDLILLKEAMGNAAAKFWQYDYLFNSNRDFASAETQAKYAGIKNGLPPRVQTYLDEIEKTFKDRIPDTPEEGTVFTSANQIYTPLSIRLTCMNNFLSQQQVAGAACEDILGEFYNGLTSLSCGGDEAKSGDVFMLLTTRKIMTATNIHDPCDKYTLKVDKFNEKGAALIRDGVAEIKNSVLKSMEDMLKNYGKEDFRVKLLQNNFYAAVHVITEYPQKADELADAVVKAHDDVFKKRQDDEFWQGVFGFIYKAAAVVGIASLVLWLIPPAGAVVTGLSSLLAAVAVGAGAFLAVGYGKDWFHEKGDYAALEKAIYSGGQGDVAGLADTMMEWKEAKNMAIWEGFFTAIGVGGARRIISDPRGVRTAYSKANIQDKWRSWREARRAAKEAKQAAKAAANTPEGIAAANKLKEDIAKARVSYKDAKKAWKQNKDNNELLEKMSAANDEYKALLAEKQRNIVARAWNRVSSSVIRAKDWGRLGRFRKGEATVDDLNEANGFFRRRIDWLKEKRAQIHFLNKQAWKHSSQIDELNKMSQLAEKSGGKINWKLVNGQAHIKADTMGFDYITQQGKTVEDFKIGRDGLWFAVLSAEKLDRFLGNRGKRTIEGRLEGALDAVTP